MDDDSILDVRYFHRTNGGLRYEVFLSTDPPKPFKRKIFTHSPFRQSLMELQDKQEKAEKRRQCLTRTRIPAEHLNRIASVRGSRKNNVKELLKCVQRCDDKIKNALKSNEHSQKSSQHMTNRWVIDVLRPHTAPGKLSTDDIRSLEEHLRTQDRLLEELNFQADNLIEVVKNIKLHTINNSD
ncbi:uncharacterized protein LOC118204822 isoform X1 [Stegodyphus dumicola]|uniref:uncharacterized protein LOC118204822 isoform X1 n=1 Tax=Stegodyphus dumicola TaxID=202533 RepID=UPI0015A87396|nr:uncharacterized protein LOC118204822 isoform X1 [Stegodyphus dumicola]